MTNVDTIRYYCSPCRVIHSTSSIWDTLSIIRKIFQQGTIEAQEAERRERMEGNGISTWVPQYRNDLRTDYVQDEHHTIIKCYFSNLESPRKLIPPIASSIKSLLGWISMMHHDSIIMSSNPSNNLECAFEVHEVLPSPLQRVSSTNSPV